MRKQGMNSWFGMCASELRVNAGRAHPPATAEKTEHVQTVSDRSPAIAHPVPLSDNRGYTRELTVPYSSPTVCHLDGWLILTRTGVSDIGDVLGKWTRASEIASQPTIAVITEWILRNHVKAQ